MTPFAISSPIVKAKPALFNWFQFNLDENFLPEMGE